MISFINDFAALFLLVVLLSFMAKLLRQPIIIGYALSGIAFASILAENSIGQQILFLSELGLTFLLFLMGLEFDLKSIKYVGKDVLAATFLQSLTFFILALGILMLFGLPITECVYLAILISFSSTLLVAKWLEDKKETNTLHGRIILATLVIQDIFAILILTAISVTRETSIANVALVLAGGLILVASAVFFAKYILNAALRFAVRFPELLFIFSIGICFLFVFISPMLGFSTSIGAFIAGVTLANTNYKSDIYGRLRPLVIFFNMLFFVGLGFQTNITAMTLNDLLIIASLTAVCLIIKPVIIAATLQLRGYDHKTSILAGLNLSQASEFGIIIIAGAVISGIVPQHTATLSVVLVILTMILSSYTIKYDRQVYGFLEKKLRLSTLNPRETGARDLTGFNIIFFGYYELSKELYSRLQESGKRMLVIDNDPVNIELLKKEGISFSYNSVANPYFFNLLSLKEAEIAVSSLVDIEDNKMIIAKVKKDNPKSLMIVTAKSLRHSIELYDAGADYVIYPTYVNEQQVSVLLEDYTKDINKLLTRRIEEVGKLREKKKRRDEIEDTFNINSYLERLNMVKKN